MTTETPVTPVTATAMMPPAVAAAIVKVARGIKAIAKNGVNEHGKYMFTSVDDFYNAVGPVMAEAGLFTFADLTHSETNEVETVDNYGKVKRNSYLSMEFDICLVHESGAMSMPVKRSVTVIAAGPQAYASGESFVTKYFIRNLFKVPTGDYDADQDEKTELPASRAKQTVKPPAKQNIQTTPENRVDPEQQSQPEEQPEQPAKNTKLKPVLEFVAKVNEFLDTKPDAAALFKYEGGADVNARMKRIRSDEFSAVPAVADLVKRMNAIYASAGDAEREVGQDG